MVKKSLLVKGVLVLVLLFFPVWSLPQRMTPSEFKGR